MSSRRLERQDNSFALQSGDTLFASGEELYNRLSPSFAAYLETLEAVHAGLAFIDEVKRNGGGLYVSPGLRIFFPEVAVFLSRYQGERGSPFNKNQDLTAIHPVVRINPATGRKSIFVNHNFTKSIVGLTVSRACKDGSCSNH